jgi:hypothetical protein
LIAKRNKNTGHYQNHQQCRTTSNAAALEIRPKSGSKPVPNAMSLGLGKTGTPVRSAALTLCEAIDPADKVSSVMIPQAFPYYSITFGVRKHCSRKCRTMEVEIDRAT